MLATALAHVGMTWLQGNKIMGRPQVCPYSKLYTLNSILYTTTP